MLYIDQTTIYFYRFVCIECELSKAALYRFLGLFLKMYGLYVSG